MNSIVPITSNDDKATRDDNTAGQDVPSAANYSEGFHFE